MKTKTNKDEKMSETKTIECEVSIAREDLYLDGNINGDEIVNIEFDDALIQRIKELHNAVIGTKALAIQETNYAVKWETVFMFGEPLMVEHQTLHVSEDTVWWTCYCENTLDKVFTSEIQIEEILALETEPSKLKKIGQYYDKDLNETTFKSLGNKIKVEIPKGLLFCSEGDIEAFYTEAKKALARVATTTTE